MKVCYSQSRWLETARLLMNLLLLKVGYRPVVIRPEDRTAYHDNLEAVQMNKVRTAYYDFIE